MIGIPVFLCNDTNANVSGTTSDIIDDLYLYDNDNDSNNRSN